MRYLFICFRYIHVYMFIIHGPCPPSFHPTWNRPRGEEAQRERHTCHFLPPSEIYSGLCLLFLQARKGNVYFTLLAGRVEYGNYVDRGGEEAQRERGGEGRGVPSAS